MKTPPATRSAPRKSAPLPITPPFAQAEATISAAVHEAKTYIRREPDKAVLWALAAGYVLRMLPLAAILNALVRLLLVTLRPAIVIFGATKVWETVRESSLLQDRHR